MAARLRNAMKRQDHYPATLVVVTMGLRITSTAPPEERKVRRSFNRFVMAFLRHPAFP